MLLYIAWVESQSTCAKLSVLVYCPDKVRLPVHTGHVITGRGNGVELSAVYFLEMRNELEKDKLEDKLLSGIKSLIRDVYLSRL